MKRSTGNSSHRSSTQLQDEMRKRSKQDKKKRTPHRKMRPVRTFSSVRNGVISYDVYEKDPNGIMNVRLKTFISRLDNIQSHQFNTLKGVTLDKVTSPDSVGDMYVISDSAIRRPRASGVEFEFLCQCLRSIRNPPWTKETKTSMFTDRMVRLTLESSFLFPLHIHFFFVQRNNSTRLIRSTVLPSSKDSALNICILKMHIRFV